VTISVARRDRRLRLSSGAGFIAHKFNCESEDAMLKKPNGRWWPLKYDRQLIELARATNSLEFLAGQIKRSPAAVLRRARRLGISIDDSELSDKSKPSDRRRTARTSASARTRRMKADKKWRGRRCISSPGPSNAKEQPEFPRCSHEPFTSRS